MPKLQYIAILIIMFVRVATLPAYRFFLPNNKDGGRNGATKNLGMRPTFSIGVNIVFINTAMPMKPDLFLNSLHSWVNSWDRGPAWEGIKYLSSGNSYPCSPLTGRNL